MKESSQMYIKSQLSNISILVVGDVMLDKYYIGNVNRISPEAPVPVVHVKNIKDVPGGAANVVTNLDTLNVQSHIVGGIGKDDNGRELLNILNKSKCQTHLFKVNDSTITKIRIIGSHQQITRLDFEDIYTINDDIIKDIVYKLAKIIKEVDLIILSDYNKGFCHPKLCKELISLTKKYNKKIIVDPKGKNWKKYDGAFIITPNLRELTDMISEPVNNTDESIEKYAREILSVYNFQYILVTRSEKGMSLVSKNECIHIPTIAKEVYDVSGAGDTVIAILGMGLALDMDIYDAVNFANKAAGIVVSKFGTATVNFNELFDNGIFSKSKVFEEKKDIINVVRDYNRKNNKIVFTNGCFDIIHKGHIEILKEAKRLGDILIVGLNSDESVRRLKGKDRPINNEHDRIYMLSQFDFVDHVVMFNEETPYELIKTIKPDILVKGGDYKIEEVVGREFANETIVVPFISGYSTSNIIKKIVN